MAHQQPLRCLITGANTGLGFEVAKQLLLKGHEVILACRNPQKAQAALQQLQKQLVAHTQGVAAAPAAAQGATAATAPSNSANGTGSNSANGSGTAGSSRSSGSSGSSTPRVSVVQCDLSSFASVRSCAAAVTQGWPLGFDVLVCNAAVIPRTHARTVNGIDEQLQVNHLSHLLLVHLLLPCLVRAAEARAAAAAATAGSSGAAAGATVAGSSGAASGAAASGGGNGGGAATAAATASADAAYSSRVVVVGSGQHTQVPVEWQDPQRLQLLLAAETAGQQQQQQQEGPEGLSPMQLYALTKLCNLWFVRHLAQHVLPAAGGKVVVNAVAPGFIPNTDLSRHLAGNFLSRFAMKFIMPWAPFAVSPQEGARRVVAVCTGDAEGRSSGQFYSRGRPTPPSAAASDDASAAVCWQLSCDATGVPHDTYGTQHS